MVAANKNSDEMSESFTAFQAELRSAILASTKLATNLPVPADIGYHRTLSRQYAKQSDVASARLLKLADKLLTLVSNDNEAVLEAKATLPHSKKRKARAELDEDVVADSHSFQSNVVDCVDGLLERVDNWLDDVKEARAEAVPIASTSALPTAEAAVKATASTTVTKVSLARLPASIIDASTLPKPQRNFLRPINNARQGATFLPILTSKPHAITPLDLTPIETSMGDDSDITFQIPHPYKAELTAFADASELPAILFTPPTERQLAPMSKDSFDQTPFVYVDTVDKFQQMLGNLRQADLIAVDLEHHDLHSYHGMVALLQITANNVDYVVDPLVPEVREACVDLNEVFADPKIIKVLHGADRDILWLQRDLGVYVVGLFDTFQASKVLGPLL